eukprot:TRINITY_DN5227_c0_g1_i1.p2 TRINITY_DN5227_c0_g1~~TRINITY_DN5227_c0_g1_i1.p2  ORF type:complete len:739 (-),score=118.15 TRINITY_DN5227_c0_g1_i1:698-2914(-)
MWVTGNMSAQSFGPNAPDSRKTVECRYFVLGKCKNGDQCPFKHDEEKRKEFHKYDKYVECKFHLQGRCTKGDKCPFLHRVINKQVLPSANRSQGQQSQPLERKGSQDTLKEGGSAVAPVAQTSAPQQQQQYQQQVVLTPESMVSSATEGIEGGVEQEPQFIIEFDYSEMMEVEEQEEDQLQGYTTENFQPQKYEQEFEMQCTDDNEKNQAENSGQGQCTDQQTQQIQQEQLQRIQQEQAPQVQKFQLEQEVQQKQQNNLGQGQTQGQGQWQVWGQGQGPGQGQGNQQAYRQGSNQENVKVCEFVSERALSGAKNKYQIQQVQWENEIVAQNNVEDNVNKAYNNSNCDTYRQCVDSGNLERVMSSRMSTNNGLTELPQLKQIERKDHVEVGFDPVANFDGSEECEDKGSETKKEDGPAENGHNKQECDMQTNERFGEVEQQVKRERIEYTKLQNTTPVCKAQMSPKVAASKTAETQTTPPAKTTKTSQKRSFSNEFSPPKKAQKSYKTQSKRKEVVFEAPQENPEQEQKQQQTRKLSVFDRLEFVASDRSHTLQKQQPVVTQTNEERQESKPQKKRGGGLFLAALQGITQAPQQKSKRECIPEDDRWPCEQASIYSPEKHKYREKQQLGTKCSLPNNNRYYEAEKGLSRIADVGDNNQTEQLSRHRHDKSNQYQQYRFGSTTSNRRNDKFDRWEEGGSYLEDPRQFSESQQDGQFKFAPPKSLRELKKTKSHTPDVGII